MNKDQEIADLKKEITVLTNRNMQLNKDCCKYRIALNRIGHPQSWGIRPGHHVGIARRALVIGEKVDELPHGATIGEPDPHSNEPASWVWCERDQSWELIADATGKSVATVWTNGVWHTWDENGTGGENDSVDDRFMNFLDLHHEAKREAWKSCVKQGFLPNHLDT